MAVTKADFCSIRIKKEVIAQECLLWERFRQQQAVDWISFHPDSEHVPNWKTRIKRYQTANHDDYYPLLVRLNDEMKRQNETFSEVLPQQNESTRVLTLRAIALLEKEDPSLGYALGCLVGRVLIVECQQLVAFSSILFLGLIVIAPKPDWELHDYMENLIHEMSHIELYIPIKLEDAGFLSIAILKIKGCS